MPKPSRPLLDDPELYINRELSMLEFNRRVLEQAHERGIPLLERLRFLTICSTNLDEFFEVRVAGLKQQLHFGVQDPGPDGLSPREALRRISEQAHGLVDEQYRALNEELLVELEQQGIRILKREVWSKAQRKWTKDLFRHEVQPVLTPMGLDPAHPFPRVLNKSLNFIVSVEGTDAFGREAGMAVVQVPRSLPRVFQFPPELADSEGRQDFVLLSSIVHAHMGGLFPGMKVVATSQFRITRNSDLWVDEEEVDNLLLALKGELPGRRFGEAVRLEVADTCTEDMASFLLRHAGLDEEDLYRVHGPVNLHRLEAIYEKTDRSDLKYPAFIPGIQSRLAHDRDLFEVLRQDDVLLHHPFESFRPVVQLLKQAAKDPDVLAIKMTVYRTSESSPLVDALMDAARAGKEVTAVVELRARFDEAANIDLATRLEEAGANVVYGVVGYKAHAKLILIVRREDGGLRRYAHLGTGNYHPGTARAYTDFGLLTSNPEFAEDVHKVFLQLTGLGRVPELAKVVQSPFTLSETLHARIQREIEECRAGRPGRIAAKLNSLAEPKIIRALYEASQAGVEIDLVVRGICCLRPGVPGVSETIRVRSIVGRFLEHPRVYWFLAGGEQVTYCSSADWMVRNIFRRVEVAFPVEDPALRARVVHETLELYLLDDARAWTLQSDGTYVRETADELEPLSAQDVLMASLGAAGREAADAGRPAYASVLERADPARLLLPPPGDRPAKRRQRVS